MVKPGWPRAIFGKHLKTIAFDNIPRMTSSLQDETLVSCKRKSMKSPNLGSWVSWLGPSWLPTAADRLWGSCTHCSAIPSLLQAFLGLIFRQAWKPKCWAIHNSHKDRIKIVVGNNPATQPLLGSDFKIAQMCSAWRSSTWNVCLY